MVERKAMQKVTHKYVDSKRKKKATTKKQEEVEVQAKSTHSIVASKKNVTVMMIDDDDEMQNGWMGQPGLLRSCRRPRHMMTAFPNNSMLSGRRRGEEVARDEKNRPTKGINKWVAR